MTKSSELVSLDPAQGSAPDPRVHHVPCPQLCRAWMRPRDVLYANFTFRRMLFARQNVQLNT